MTSESPEPQVTSHGEIFESREAPKTTAPEHVIRMAKHKCRVLGNTKNWEGTPPSNPRQQNQHFSFIYIILQYHSKTRTLILPALVTSGHSGLICYNTHEVKSTSDSESRLQPFSMLLDPTRYTDMRVVPFTLDSGVVIGTSGESTNS